MSTTSLSGVSVQICLLCYTIFVAGKRRTSPGGDSDAQPSLGEQKMGSTSTYAIAIGTRHDENHSDEEILGAEERNSGGLGQPGGNAIRVTEEVKVTRS
ncbi:hypothetical protein LA080_006242 [Diaporthe eres]|uniref:Integral membrane protein n=1 Tax=Diaporthe vaccinii TaxID=105482 RepID=A0ABR4E7V8_9PEZI|nr:hypothetical protein LA080_006242 [Diaporthe eres]